MKTIYIFLLVLIFVSCQNNQDINIKLKKISLEDIENNINILKVTVGDEKVWLNKNEQFIFHSEIFDYNKKSSSLKQITENDLIQFQMIFELKEDSVVKARGVSELIDVNNPREKYEVLVSEINKSVNVPNIHHEISEQLKGLTNFSLTSLPDGNILIWGGIKNGKIKNNIYYYRNGKIDQLNIEPKPYPRHSHVACLFYKDNKPYVMIAGGEIIDDNNNTLTTNKSSIFDVTNNKISDNKYNDLKAARKNSSCVSMSLKSNDKGLYIIGGSDGANFPGIEYYDIKKDSFKKLNTMVQWDSDKLALDSPSVHYIGNSQVIVAGGKDLRGEYNDKIYTLDFSFPNFWSLKLSNIPKLSEKKSKISSYFDGKNIYYAGGELGNNSYSNKIEIFDTLNNSIYSTCSINAVNHLLGISKTVGSKFLISKGNFAYLFDGTCNNKEITLNTNRINAKSILTNTGQVLFIGGESNNSPAEIISTEY